MFLPAESNCVLPNLQEDDWPYQESKRWLDTRGGKTFFFPLICTNYCLDKMLPFNHIIWLDNHCEINPGELFNRLVWILEQLKFPFLATAACFLTLFSVSFIAG